MVNSLVAGWSVRENLSLAHARRMEIGHTGLLSHARERDCAEASVQRMRVKTHSIQQTIDELSGGNKQKISLGKWLFADGPVPTYRVMIFIEPTEGVDVGAKAEIHRLILELAEAGLGIVVVSSDLLEVQSLADRLLVFRQGRVCEEFLAEQFTDRHLIDAMAGEIANERSANHV
jgi:ribose transport system ATP-binding protein